MNHKNESQFAHVENINRRTRQRVFVVSTIIGLLVAITMIIRFVKTERHSMRKAVCASNLSTLGFALHRYSSEHGRFPSDIVSPNGKPLLSWRVELLQVLDPDLFSRFDLSQAWDSKANLPLQYQIPAWYICPADFDGQSKGISSYYAIAQPKLTDDTGSEGSFQVDVDSDHNCILLVEAFGLRIPWTCPGDFIGSPCNVGTLAPDLASSACNHPSTPYAITIDCQRVSLGH